MPASAQRFVKRNPRLGKGLTALGEHITRVKLSVGGAEHGREVDDAAAILIGGDVRCGLRRTDIALQ
jgi:hypothetical protein